MKNENEKKNYINLIFIIIFKWYYLTCDVKSFTTCWVAALAYTAPVAWRVADTANTKSF